MTCLINGCNRKTIARNLCGKHYQRAAKYGWPEGAVSTSNAGKPAAFLKVLCQNPPSECVPWPFCKSGSGYGQIKKGKRMYGAHREALRIYAGPPPSPNMVAAHDPVSCGSRMCVNPRHLRWATQKENQRDRLIEGTYCRGVTSPTAKLTRGDVLAIVKDKRTRRAVAFDYGVTPEAISHIMLGKTWAHVTGIRRSRA
jgi:hypothetical protein